MQSYIMAFDAGTTSVRCLIFDRQGRICGQVQEETTQYFPHPGWVEQDASEIWTKQLAVAREAMRWAGISAKDIAALGITNQRETVIVWDRVTGEPVSPAIVWQCRRTADYTSQKKEEMPELDAIVRAKTGLKFDPYFSGTKLRWILENVEGVRERAEKGELCFGTVDSWLIWNLTGGRVHVTDYTNACRTLLFNIHTLEWDPELCELLEIPMSLLPEAKPSSCIYGETEADLFGEPIPIAGAAGDQQAALFGQTCFEEGEAKNTYGTGCFMMLNTGKKPVESAHGLLTTIAWGIGGEITYALEGSVYVAGAAIQWLRDEVELIENAKQSEEFATKVKDTNGCYVVPAFTGLAAPYWDPYARGAIVGLTLGVNKYHILRATLESLAFQTYDVLHSMRLDYGNPLTSLKVDGGASRNNFLMQFQADIIAIPCHRPQCVETTGMGAAFLAGLAVGFFKDMDEIRAIWETDRVFEPAMEEERRQAALDGWKQAVAATLGWAAPKA